jgi:hypothetical protein
MPRLRAIFGLLTCLAASSCVGTTGGDLFTFDAAAAGPADADPSRPFTFVTGLSYEVTLTRAKVHIGAVYLNRAVPVSGAQATNCILPGIYIAEVTRGLDVDALSPALQPFPQKGEALQDHGVVGEVWLTGGDVNALDDPTVILDVAGTAEKGGAAYPFEGTLTIGQNRAVPTNDPSQPGANPICKQRIVSPIPTSITPRAGGSLLVRVDPRGLFSNVDFSALEQTQSSPPLYRFVDETVGQPNVNLYRGLQATQGTYELFWSEEPM